MVMMMATEKLPPRNVGLASSADLPTDSNPDINQGTTCQTRRMEMSGEWLKRGYKLAGAPCLAPARAKPMTNARKVKVVNFKKRVLVWMPRKFSQVKKRAI